MSAKPAFRNRRILIIEDEPDIALLLLNAFTLEGWDVVSVTSGFETMLHKRRYVDVDVVCVDLMLGHQVSGIHILAAIRDEPTLSHIVRIVYSSAAEEVYNGDVSGLAHCWIQKPTEPSYILTKAEQFMREKGLWE